MTYRRLFISLCLAGLFMLAGAWWSSFNYYFDVRVLLPGDWLVGGAVCVGDVHFDAGPDDGTYSASGGRAFVTPINKVLNTANYRVFGDLDWGRVLMDGESSTGSYYIYYSQTPLWLVYLAFVSIAYLALLRPMRKQRLLEEQGASSSNSAPAE